jgi:hypothetical protein
MSYQALFAWVAMYQILRYLENMDDKLLYLPEESIEILNNHFLAHFGTLARFIPLTKGNFPMIYPTDTLCYN